MPWTVKRLPTGQSIKLSCRFIDVTKSILAHIHSWDQPCYQSGAFGLLSDGPFSNSIGNESRKACTAVESNVCKELICIDGMMPLFCIYTGAIVAKPLFSWRTFALKHPAKQDFQKLLLHSVINPAALYFLVFKFGGKFWKPHLTNKNITPNLFAQPNLNHVCSRMSTRSWFQLCTIKGSCVHWSLRYHWLNFTQEGLLFVDAHWEGISGDEWLTPWNYKFSWKAA